MDEQKNLREKKIIRTSVIGIGANLLLALFKAIVGVLTNSIAIILDAVNNLTDAASSVITIVGTKLAGRQPDRKHPFGYGRAEYLSAMAISVLVLYAGITALIESVKKIIAPEQPTYTAVSLIIVAVAVVAKILLGRYVKAVGKAENSDSLINSGEDATLDAVISASTLVAAAIFLLFHISLEAWLGAVIALVIIKSGFEMLSETLSRILGQRVDAQIIRDIKQTVMTFEEVKGVYDVSLTDFGPDAYRGSLHIEVPDTCTASDLDELTRAIQIKVYQTNQIILNAISVYSINTKDPFAVEAWETVRELVMAQEYVKQIHGFFISREKKTLRFDAVVSFDAPDRSAVYRGILEAVQAQYPEYTLNVALDIDLLETE